MKAIETKWKGYRFRSRTEARWAVFLDTLGVAFDYESEGVILPSGPYLPDFRLRRFPGVVGERQDVWLEIKGGDATHEERFRCAELAGASGCLVLLAEGSPDCTEQVWLFDPAAENPALESWLICGLSFCNQPDTGRIAVGRTAIDPAERIAVMEQKPEVQRESWWRWHESCFPYDPPFLAILGGPASGSRVGGPHEIGPDMRQAFDAARSARFEFGQADPRWLS